MLLADELAERARAHPVRERPQRIAVTWGARSHDVTDRIPLPRRAHSRGVPITSAPAGGVKLTSPGATGPLRSILSKLMVAV